jgi:uracil DNA glycosylase
MTYLNYLPLDSSRQQYLTEEFNKAYMQKLLSFLQQQAQQKKIIYPEENQSFLFCEGT